MGWEESGRRRRSCPCGKGEYEETYFSDDWNRTETRREMLCPDCRELYVYDSTVMYGRPGDEVERGWVLNSTLEAERRQREELEDDFKTCYFEAWKSRFINLRNKKEIWEALTLNGRYYPTLATFYQHTKGYGDKQLSDCVDSFFKYSNRNQIIELCERV